LLAVLASITEAMSFGLLIPIIEASKESGSLSNVPLIGVFSDLFAGLESQEKVMAAAVALLIMTLLRGGIVWAGEVASYSLPPRIDSKVKLRVFNALSLMPISKIEKISAGDFSVSTAEGPARIGISVRFLQMLVSNVIVVSINTAFLLIISPIATLTMVGSLLLLMFFYRLFTVPRLSKSGENFTNASTQFNQLFYEIINNQVSSRLSGSRDSVIGKIGGAISGVRNANLKKLLVEASVFPFFSTAIGISFCLLLVFVALLGKTADAELIAKVVAIIYLMSRLLGPITVINVARVNLLANWHVVDKVVEFLDFAEKNKRI
jgi:ABC-type bacteriocin/lantibiotic exporter with double-glycine peptidase domain